MRSTQQPKTVFHRKKHLKYVLFVPAAVFFSTVCFVIVTSLATPTQFTDDDSDVLNAALLSSQYGTVLGANTSENTNNPCGELTPIIGWIDIKGNKRIVQTVPTGFQPSACYASVQQAQKDGFDYLQ